MNYSKPMRQICFYLLLFTLTSCAGYRVKRPGNPFSENGIKTISIPMFVNHSVIPNVSSPMTKEISLMLSGYPKLRVFPGENRKADAILLGIITSAKHRKDVIKTKSRVLIQGDLLEDSIGNRNQFYVPTASEITLDVQLVLIKNPSPEEIKILKSSIGSKVRSSKIVFNEKITVVKEFARDVRETTTVDSGGTVNSTKSKASMESGIEGMAESLGTTFKELVLNVF